mmetsp:Transcript_15648/g.47318  ORF Transcript_15648/g.47318 Transcript_15648/m.47318 type:complete len:273 (+) Transcript_15648:295-1113(+)
MIQVWVVEMRCAAESQSVRLQRSTCGAKSTPSSREYSRNLPRGARQTARPRARAMAASTSPAASRNARRCIFRCPSPHTGDAAWSSVSASKNASSIASSTTNASPYDVSSKASTAVVAGLSSRCRLAARTCPMETRNGESSGSPRTAMSSFRAQRASSIAKSPRIAAYAAHDAFASSNAPRGASWEKAATSPRRTALKSRTSSSTLGCCGLRLFVFSGKRVGRPGAPQRGQQTSSEEAARIARQNSEAVTAQPQPFQILLPVPGSLPTHCQR